MFLFKWTKYPSINYKTAFLQIKNANEIILANFCPVMRDLDKIYQLGDLNKKVAELLSANAVGPALDEQLLRFGDDVKAVNPLWLKKNVEDCDDWILTWAGSFYNTMRSLKGF
jgi:hypothetical protein